MSQSDHIAGLEEKIRGQAERIRSLQAVEDFRKRQLDALHYVWCTGGCERGIHRFGEHPPLTRILLADAMGCVARMTKRLLSEEFKGVAATLDRPTYQQIKDRFDIDEVRADLKGIADTLRTCARRLNPQHLAQPPDPLKEPTA